MFKFGKKDNDQGHRVITTSTDPSPTRPVVQQGNGAGAGDGDWRARPQLRAVLFAEHELRKGEELAIQRVPFVRCINAELGLAQYLYINVAIVQAVENAKTAVLLLTSSVNPGDIEELQQLLGNKGWSLPSEGPQAWRAASQVVISVSQGHLGQSQMDSIRATHGDRKKSSLWASFVEMVQWAYEADANDIDCIVRAREEYSQIAFKVDGHYVSPDRYRLATSTLVQMLGVAWQRSEGGSDPNFQINAEQQASITIDLPKGDRVRLRWSGWSLDTGCAVTMRMQRIGASTVIHSLAEAGCLPWQISILERTLVSRGGLTTFSGEVGSGKSVMLAILMTMLRDGIKIIEVSDPVEIDLGYKVLQKTVARDITKTGDASEQQFAAAVRGIFRSALDVCLLGEIRDPETALVARTIMESGHSVYTTTHAKSAIGIFAKYASPQCGIPMDVLATPGNIRLNVFQSLLPKLCPHCALTNQALIDDSTATDVQAHQTSMECVSALYGLPETRFRFRNPQGCHHCRKPDMPSRNGYAGRTVVMELIEPDEAMCELVQANDRVGLLRYWRSLASASFDDPDLNGKTAMECAIYKAQMGLIDLRDIERHFEHFETAQRKRSGQRLAVPPAKPISPPKVFKISQGAL